MKRPLQLFCASCIALSTLYAEGLQTGLYEQNRKEERQKTIDEIVLTAPIHFDEKITPKMHKVIGALEHTQSIIDRLQSDSEYAKCRELLALQRYALEKSKSAQILLSQGRIDANMKKAIDQRAKAKAKAYDSQLATCKQNYDKGLL